MSSTPKDNPATSKRQVLEKELRQWWCKRNEEWGSKSGGDVEGDLWEETPEIDSKEVVKAGNKCEPHLDGEFDTSIVQEGGYSSIEDLIDDLVPKMIEDT